ncbi:hypothetical protein ACJIZ3_007032 [Penstemon smallii]|uniref:Cytochrome P450 n=1 Tax=Penstemon smallii TaxID=265156 RepID=A0ABD3S9J3_9LAMI
MVTNWPLLGMLSGLLQHSHRVHDKVTQVFIECDGTVEFKGPWFCKMDMLATGDPANINHILTENFSNYPKGPEFRKIFEILEDGILNVESELWKFHRRSSLLFMNHVDNGLFPVLDYFSEHGTDVDLQDIFQRLAFDIVCKMILDYDPRSLCNDLPYIPAEKTFNDAVDALFYRHVLPESIWKLQKWLGIEEDHDDDDFNFFKFYRKAYEENNKNDGSWTTRTNSRDFLRDISLNYMLASRDATSTCLTWLFWLIATNPLVEVKILQEIKTILHLKEDKKWRLFNVEESHKLVYLHGALCESLRLFPPVPLQHKTSTHPDILPSGHYIGENAKVIISFYSVGRMEKVWGKDCLEFKPERWITEHGKIKHEPSYKFPAFNAGPRTCPGKKMSLIQMKMVAASIIYNYNVQLLKGHPVSPSDSIILKAKHGLWVRLSRRNVV